MNLQVPIQKVNCHNIYIARFVSISTRHICASFWTLLNSLSCAALQCVTHVYLNQRHTPTVVQKGQLDEAPSDGTQL